MDDENVSASVKMRLVEAGGRTSQDLGLGRIVGQILACLYLTDGELSLDDIGGDLGISKAAVSVAVRQLESLALVRRVWKKGDRRNYYRTAEDVGAALRNGLLALLRQKIAATSLELDNAAEALKSGGRDRSPETEFLYGRVKRARELCERASKVVESPLLKLFTRQ
jgi:DNA-binding transcriptional regulator GbsR (MarR family)